MRYTLESLDSLPAVARERLAAMGILDTDALLERGVTPARRQELARAAGLDLTDLTRWAGLSDLLRIKGIGPATADLLVDAGILSVQQFLAALKVPPRGAAGEAGRLATRAAVPGAAEELAARLRRPDPGDPGTHRPPSARELAESAEEAAELRPRLVVSEPEGSAAFRQEVHQRALRSARQGARTSLVLCAIAALVAVLFLSIVELYVLHETRQAVPASSSIAPAFQELVRLTMRFALQEGASFVVLGITGVLLVFAVYAGYTFLLETAVVRLLFNTPQHRDYFRQMVSLAGAVQTRATRRAIWIAAMTLGGLAVYLGISTALAIRGGTSPDSVPLLFVPPLMLAVVLIAWPTLRHFVRLRASGLRDADESFRRYLVYLIGHWAALPLAILLLVRLVMPGVTAAQASVSRHLLVPHYVERVSNWRASLEHLDPQSEADQARLSKLLADSEPEAARIVALMESWSPSALQPAANAALNFIAWLGLLGIAILFLAPYLVLGGMRRGLFYIALLAISFKLEDWLQAAAPSWFMLRPGSIGAWLSIAFALLASALAIDWLYDTITEPKKTCPHCQKMIAADAGYCPLCGQVQP